MLRGWLVIFFAECLRLFYSVFGGGLGNEITIVEVLFLLQLVHLNWMDILNLQVLKRYVG